MNINLPDTEQNSVSSQQGWEQMKFLLDINLPERRNRTIRDVYESFAVAAGLLLIFSLSSLQLQKFTARFDLIPNASLANKSSEKNINTNKTIDLLSVDKSSVAIIGINTGSKSAKIKKIHSQGYKVDNIEQYQIGSVDALLIPEMLAPIHHPFFEEAADTNKQFPNHVNILSHPLEADTSWRNTPPDKSFPDNKWNLAAGIAVNTQFDKLSILRPFPVVHIQYNVSSRYYVSAGVMGGASISGRNNGIAKTVYLNDTVNDIQYYDKVTHFPKLYYLDIPLVMGFNVTKNLSVVSGVQASILLNAKMTSTINTYDFQRASSNMNVNALAIPVIREDLFELKVKELDYRFSSGLKYTHNNMSYNLMYQKSLQPVLTGNHINSHKNELVTFSIQYKMN